VSAAASESISGLYGAPAAPSAAVAPTSSKAAYLLARNGFDVQSYRSLLHKLSLKRSSYESQQPLYLTDLHGYLTHEHHMLILTSIEEAKKETQNMFYERYGECVNDDWNRAKEVFMNLVGSRGVAQQPRRDAMDVDLVASQRGLSSQAQQQIGTRGHTKMTSKMQIYANAVLKLNQERSDSHLPIIQDMKACAEKVDESPGRRNEIIQCWDLLKTLMDEDAAVFKAITKPYSAYSTEHSKTLEKKFIAGAKSYLERQYLNHMREICTKYSQDLGLSQQELSDSSAGSVKKLIESYVDHRYRMPSTNEWRTPTVPGEAQSSARIQLSNGRPMWALIFYALRCGRSDIALDFTKDTSFSTEQDVQLVHRLLSSDSHISPEDESVRSTVAQKYRTSDYIFKKAVLLVLGKTPQDESLRAVFQKLEDFVWQKLMLIPMSTRLTAQTSVAFYSLQKLQEQIVGLGPQYFSVQRNRTSLMYFKLLLMIQEFERAIAYLFGRDVDGYRTEAVHFAIALDYYGVLRQIPFMDAPLLSEPGNEPRNHTRLNYSFLLRDYVRVFAHTDPREAVSYLCRISIPRHRIKCIKDLVIESQDTSAILGSISSDELRKIGIIEDVLSRQEFKEILDMAAEEYQRTGRHEAAIKLHFLAADVKRGTSSEANKHLAQSLNIVTKDLSRVLSLDTSEKEDVVELARDVFNRTSGNEQLTYERHTLDILLRLYSFFEDAKKNRFADALEKIKQVRLLPLDNLGIEEAYQNFTKLDDAVKEVVVETIVESMRCLQGLARTQKDYRSQMSIRSNATDLMEFARRVNFVGPHGDAYERVLRFDFYLNQ